MPTNNPQANAVSLAKLLQLRRSNDSLGVSESDWRSALGQASADPAVGIRHAAIRGDASYRIHVAAIPQQVGCHFHRIGDEDYSVVEGQGVLHFGPVTDGNVRSGDWKQMTVSAGDTFVIPQGYAHQLRRTGAGDLTILFGCPDSHINDAEDRTILPDAPR